MGAVIVEGEGAVLGVNLGHPIVICNHWELCCVVVWEWRRATRSSQITLGRTCCLYLPPLQQTNKRKGEKKKSHTHTKSCKQKIHWSIWRLTQTCTMYKYRVTHTHSRTHASCQLIYTIWCAERIWNHFDCETESLIEYSLKDYGGVYVAGWY